MGFLTQRFGLTRYEADEYYSQALDDYQKGSLQDAIDKIGFALALLPQNSEYYAARGLFFMEDGITDKAKENFAQALAIHDGEVLANYGMGAISFRDKAWDDAIIYFNKARAVNPTQIEIPYYLALVYHRQQDNATAKIYMEQAHQLMEDAGDKRRTDARRWLREFEKLLKQQENVQDETPVQSALPLKGGRVSLAELEATKPPSLPEGKNEPDQPDNDDTDEAE